MGGEVLPTSATGYFQDLANSFLIQSGVTKSPSCWSMISHVFPPSIIPFTLHFTLPHIQKPVFAYFTQTSLQELFFTMLSQTGPVYSLDKCKHFLKGKHSNEMGFPNGALQSSNKISS